MDYDFIPTSVFTALEYGSCGFSEEAAIEKFFEICFSKKKLDFYFFKSFDY